jgi:hypothetical protein
MWQNRNEIFILPNLETQKYYARLSKYSQQEIRQVGYLTL